MDLVVLRDGEKVELNDVTWGTYTGTEGETYQGYGVYIARDQIEEANLWTILKTSWLNTIDFVRIVRLSLQMLVTGQAGMDDLSGRWASSPLSPRWAPRQRPLPPRWRTSSTSAHAGGEPGSDEHAAHPGSGRRQDLLPHH